MAEASLSQAADPLFPESGVALVREALQRDGLFVLDHRYDEPFCNRIKTFIDEFPRDQAEINYAGTEVRVWRAHEKDADIAQFAQFADRLLSEVFAKTVAVRDVLAIRNLAISPDEELMMGRWHLDSLREQIKVFLFLSDVTEKTGPLELIPGSHAASFKIRGTAGGRLLHPKDFLGDTRRYQKLDDAWVAQKVTEAGGARPILCRAGTVAVVNTSAVHRARPCLEDSRYALTAYYDHF